MRAPHGGGTSLHQPPDLEFDQLDRGARAEVPRSGLRESRRT
jgi:hypothetical protein